jgi:hypothetical protein
MKEREPASTSEMTRFEAQILTTRKNLKPLRDGWVAHLLWRWARR